MKVEMGPTDNMQIVVLAAGRGSRMTGLLGTIVPKCFIPFAGNPLLFYCLKSLQLNGYGEKEILVITQDRDDVRRTVLQLGERLELKLDTFGVPEDSDDFGTAESLRLAMLAKKITRDCLIISCDLVGELPIKEMVEMHNKKNSSFTSLYMKNVPTPTVPLPGPKMKHATERDIIGVKEDTQELVFMMSEADLDDELALPFATLHKYPTFKLVTWLTDCHLYIVKKVALDLLFTKHDNEEKYISLKGEFLPWIVQRKTQSDCKAPFLTSHAYIDSHKQCIRINSIHNYIVVSKSRDWLDKIYPNCCTRAKETKIAKNAKLNTATLGDHCNVAEKCKLTNVIGLDHVQIEANCDLQNIIISSNAQIGTGAVLKDCLVGPKYQVPAGGSHTNEHLNVIEETFFEP